MSQADELLNSLSNNGVSLALADEATEPHIIIGDDRFIVVPDSLKRIAVQFDHDVETVTFDCPRYWDGLDMSKLAIYINYMIADDSLGCYKATNIVIDGTDSTVMHFNWTISRNVTLIPGNLKFLVCIKKTDSKGNEVNHWNSELCTDMYVSQGLETEETVLEPYPDIISQWETEVQAVKDILLAARDSGELNGATFTPSVDSNGNLSWTNDRGLPNPTTFNIKGYSPRILVRDIDGGHELIITDQVESKTVQVLDGVSPTIAITTITGGHRVTITDANGSKSFDVMDGANDISGAVVEYMDSFVQIGGTEPTSGPILWFDVSEVITNTLNAQWDEDNLTLTINET